MSELYPESSLASFLTDYYVLKTARANNFETGAQGLLIQTPSWPTSLTMLAFAMAYSSCALSLRLRDSGLSPLLTSQENTPSLFL